MAQTRKGLIPLIAGFFCLILMWHMLSVSMASKLILPGPLAVFYALISLFTSLDFWQSLGISLARTSLAFVLCLVISLPLGIATAYVWWFEKFCLPFLSVLRSTPVISVIILGLIWFPPNLAPVWVCLLMIVPMLVQAVQEGVKARDKHLEEMSQQFSIPLLRQLRGLLLPGLVPFLRSGTRAALGVGWKVVAAAEVLSMPRFGIGSLLQNARTMLETDTVFAATAMILLIAGLGDALLDLVLRLPNERPRVKRLSI